MKRKTSSHGWWRRSHWKLRRICNRRIRISHSRIGCPKMIHRRPVTLSVPNVHAGSQPKNFWLNIWSQTRRNVCYAARGFGIWATWWTTIVCILVKNHSNAQYATSRLPKLATYAHTSVSTRVSCHISVTYVIGNSRKQVIWLHIKAPISLTSHTHVKTVRNHTVNCTNLLDIKRNTDFLLPFQTECLRLKYFIIYYFFF